jgi:hypothetical protein
MAPIMKTPASFPGRLAARCAHQSGLQRRRQLQVVDAEHRQRHPGDQQAERAQHPRVLQRRRQPFASQARSNAKQGVDNRHAERIRNRQDQPAPAVRGALAHDDRRQDRHHRQHAGRERQAQAKQDECRDDGQQLAFAEDGGNAGQLRAGCGVRHGGGWRIDDAR